MKSLFLILASFSLQVLATEIDLSQSKSKVEFLAVTTVGPKIKGTQKEGAGISGKLQFEKNALSGSATVLIDSFDTGIGLRNNHMKDYLNAKAHPEVKVSLKPIQFANPNYEGPFEADVTLNGQTKPVKGLATLDSSSGKVLGKLSFDVDITEFGIKIPSYLGVTVKNIVKTETILQ